MTATARARLAQLAFEWDRRTYERLHAANRARVSRASAAQLADVVAWLNDNEPHILRTALDEENVK